MKMHLLIRLVGSCLFLLGVLATMFSNKFNVIGLLGMCAGMVLTLIGMRLSKKRAASQGDVAASSATRRKRMKQNILLFVILAVLIIPFNLALLGILPTFARLPHNLKIVVFCVDVVMYIGVFGGIIIMFCIKLSKLPKDGDS